MYQQKKTRKGSKRINRKLYKKNYNNNEKLRLHIKIRL